MHIVRPRVAVGALRGGSGKTILSLGLIAAWRETGRSVAPFKKGPDFIDAGWMTFASAQSCCNLDPFLMSGAQILESFLSRSIQSDISIIEGNRGLYDGLDAGGSSSTAELAKLLKTPVLLVVDVTMATRTMAALVKGCQAFDPDLHIAGVILNRVAGSRQEMLITRTIEEYCDTSVLGSVPKLQDDTFPDRHMGLVPYQEREHADKAISWAKAVVKKHLGLEKIWRIAHDVEDIDIDFQEREFGKKPLSEDCPRIGIIRDRSFWFYYPENIEQLEQLGAVLVEVNAISHERLPQLDALYIGGGFPETKAQDLSKNLRFRDSLREEIEKGLPVYAECGGFMYLGESLFVDGKEYPMVGALPVRFILEKRPQGHGYTVLETTRSNPYYTVGDIVKGHEFHYSRADITREGDIDFIFKVNRGHGVDGRRDGLCRKNVLATYTHVHAAGDPRWAEILVNVACGHRKT
ncbi:MAG: cobyrinate a,c-diamide synthase [Thermodesulfobacteriota bacterium]|nr:cobyrinate a,c-diamide synthase [Thermodesulfobacteriota bacterium]